jgi:hypothetical protein
MFKEIFMRNYGLFFSALSFTILVFSSVVSFWVTDPMLTKIGFLTFGVLASLSIYLTCLALPSEADRIEKQNNLDGDINLIWARINENRDQLDKRIDDTEREFYQQLNEFNRDCQMSISDISEHCEKTCKTKTK